MKMEKKEVIIIGAGLTGLALGHMLKAKGVAFLILEARSRSGGRIYTEGLNENKPIELGATWLGQQHRHLLAFLSELNIGVFPQHFGERAFVEPISTSPPYIASLPGNDEPSFRIQGGSGSLISLLERQIGKDRIRFSESVLSIRQNKDGLELSTPDHVFHADKVVSTLPPNLLVNKIAFESGLPEPLVTTALSTHTWMGESIKIALSFKEPFWSSSNSSGTVLSNVGPISELYDHSNYERSFFALKGFFSGSYYSISKEERLEKVLNQLRKYYGDQVDGFDEYHEKVWQYEPQTYHEYESHVLPHQNNGHELFQQSYLGGRLIIGGSETSQVFPGYMEGAVHSAIRIAQQL